MSMNFSPNANVPPIALEGFESFLDEGHVELLTNTVSESTTSAPSREYDKAASTYETRTLLELLGQIEKVKELLRETNERLLSAYARIGEMEKVTEDQERRLALLPQLEAQANQALVLQKQLDTALEDLDKLRQPWWNRLTRRK